jgi:hypothetical protein
MLRFTPPLDPSFSRLVDKAIGRTEAAVEIPSCSVGFDQPGPLLIATVATGVYRQLPRRDLHPRETSVFHDALQHSGVSRRTLWFEMLSK